MKRFWREVIVGPAEGGHAVLLDGRRVNTPGRVPLVLPSAALAEAVANEWRGVEAEIAPVAMRLTGLANAAVERIAADPAPFVADLARYGESDLLCYRAADPPELAAREAAAWDPLLAWAAARYDVHFEVVSGLIHRPQPPATLARLTEAVAAQGPFELAALTPIVTITGTLVGALALLEGAVSPDALWSASRIDEDFQQEQWGEDWQASETTATRRLEYDAAVALLMLL